MPVARANNQTGFLGATLAAGSGVGGSINLGAPWLDVTVSGPSYVKLLLQPPVIAGQPSLAFEAVYATVINGNSTATIVARGQEGTTAQAHNLGTVWTCGPTAQDFTSDLGPIAETQVTNLTTDLAAKATVTALSAETTRATAAEGTNATAISTETTRATAAEALKAPLASPTFTGTVTVPDGVNPTDAAQFSDVTDEQTRAQAAEALLAPLASPTFTGTVTIPDAVNPTDAAQLSDVTDATVAMLGTANTWTQPQTLPLLDNGGGCYNVRNPVFGAFGDVRIVFDGSTDGTTKNLTCASAPFAAAVPGMSVVVAAPGVTAARNDGTGGTGTVSYSSASAVITDNQAIAGDIGKAVTGSNIPAGSWVTAVSAGVSVTLNTPPTGSGTAITISNVIVDTIASVTSSSLIVLTTGVANLAAGTGLSGLTVQFGHDDTAAIQAAINAAGTVLYNLPSALATGLAVEVLIPAGQYFVRGLTSLTSPVNVATGGFYQWRTGSIILRGAGMDATTLVQIDQATSSIGIFRPGNRALSITTTAGSTAATSAGVLATDQDAGLSGNGISGAQISAVVPGVSLTLSRPANVTGTNSYTVQTRVPRFEFSGLTLFGNQSGTVDRLNRPIGCFPRNGGNGMIQSLPAPYQTQVEPHYPYGLGGTAAARADASCTVPAAGGTVITDTHITSMDVGSTVTEVGGFIQANTTITAVTPGTSFTISQVTVGAGGTETVSIQPYAISTATSSTTLTDANATWAVNQWVGALVFIDEDKASNTLAGTGCGYGYVQSNTATVLTLLAWIPTRGSAAYAPSGQNVRYRIHLQAIKPSTPEHRFERVRFLGPRGFAITCTVPHVHFSACVFDQGGQSPEAAHSDTLSSTGGTYTMENCLYLNGRGSYGDGTGAIAGMFPRFLLFGNRSVNWNVANILSCGVGSVISNNNFESQPGSGGIGYDGTVIECNRGNNLVVGNNLANMNVNASGLTSTRNDRTVGNLAGDSPFGVMGSPPAVLATTVPIRNTIAVDCTVYVTAGAGSTTVVAINGTTVQTIAASATASIRVPSGTSITLTYTSAPTWVWAGD